MGAAKISNWLLFRNYLICTVYTIQIFKPILLTVLILVLRCLRVFKELKHLLSFIKNIYYNPLGEYFFHLTKIKFIYTC